MDSHFPSFPTLPYPTLPYHPHPPWASLQKTAGKKGVFINGTAPFLLVRHNRETWRMWRCVLHMYFVHTLASVAVLLARSDQSTPMYPGTVPCMPLRPDQTSTITHRPNPSSPPSIVGGNIGFSFYSPCTPKRLWLWVLSCFINASPPLSNPSHSAPARV